MTGQRLDDRVVPDTDQVDYVPVEDLSERGHPENPKAHDLDTLVASIRRFGFAEPVVVDQRTGLVLSGHGRVEAVESMRHTDQVPPAGIADGWRVPVYIGWASSSDDEARAALVALNRIGETGGWDTAALSGLLDRLADVEGGLTGVGYAQDELDDLRAQLEDEPDGRGDLLAAVDVTLPEPSHQPGDGQVWALGTHYLVVAEVVDGWHQWVGFLDVDSRLLIPYAGVYAVLTEQSEIHPMLLVQPNPYIAGLILDRWHEATGQAPTLLR